jgi:hypothetical protein
MTDRTLQHEIEPIVRRRPDARDVRRSGAPVADIALDLQRQAGNRSVVELLGRAAPPVTGRGAAGTLAALAGSRQSGQVTAAPRTAPASVQREPCADCPDALEPAMRVADAPAEPSTAG